MRDSLGFAGSLEVSGVADGLMCVPVLDNEAGNSSAKRLIPGESRSLADLLITTLDEAPLTDYEEGGAFVEVFQKTAAHALKVRNEYLEGLMDIKGVWEKAESQGSMTAELSAALSDRREKVRFRARQSSQIGSFPYEIVDKYRNKASVNRKLAEKLTDGRHAEVARSSFKSNEKWTKGIVLAEKTAKVLNKINNVATIVSVGLPAAQVFSASTEAEEMAALRKLYKASFSAGLGAGGSVIGGYMCTSLGLTTAGWGFLSCGVLVGGLGLAGGEAGEVIGDKVFSVVGSRNLRILKRIKTGPTQPSLRPGG